MADDIRPDAGTPGAGGRRGEGRRGEGELERITAGGPDELEEQLAEQPAKVCAERDELAVAERVLEPVSRQLANERASVGPSPGQLGGRAVMLIPHREPGVGETMLPPDDQRILAAVRQAAGPVMAGRSARCWGWTPVCGAGWSRFGVNRSG
ncbi:hypothetical protein [Streptomyces marianii]|uniref:hypothetical protein n=1 Tax=Streptomyces marianii TaxID=1817406 RepID=UPI001F29C232|nr:hypothetical protein [Streptomyces marianii]